MLPCRYLAKSLLTLSPLSTSMYVGMIHRLARPPALVQTVEKFGTMSEDADLPSAPPSENAFHSPLDGVIPGRPVCVGVR